MLWEDIDLEKGVVTIRRMQERTGELSENGGAARFVYEALNHSFRHLEGRQELLINTKLDTEAAACQTATRGTCLRDASLTCS